MMTTMPYRCRMCGRAGEAAYDDEFVVKAEYWKELLHCDRCGDFKERFLFLRERTSNVAIAFWAYQTTNRLDTELENRLREKLVRLTRQIVEATCRHWRVMAEWSPDFVQMIVEQPRRAEFIVNFYAKGVRKDSPLLLQIADAQTEKQNAL